MAEVVRIAPDERPCCKGCDPEMWAFVVAEQRANLGLISRSADIKLSFAAAVMGAMPPTAVPPAEMARGIQRPTRITEITEN